MKAMHTKWLTGAAGLVVALAALILLNALASLIRVRADLTGDKLYTLSPGTRALLKNLDRDITLKLYFSRSAEQTPITFKQYGNRILDLLREYASTSGGRVALEMLDPKPDSDAEEWAQRYGLTATRLDAAGELPPVYLGLVAIAGGRQSTVPFFSPADEPQLEYILSRLIYEVATPTKPKIGVISPLPVMGAMGTMFTMGREQDPWIVMQELRAIAEIVDLPGAITEVPEDIETLLVIHPRNIPDTALYALDQFVMRGGRLIAFVDPLSLTELETQNRSFRDPFSVRSDLNRLTSVWGVSMADDRVAADNTAATRVTMPDGSVDRHRAWLTLRESNFNRSEVAVSALSLMQMPLAGWFSGAPTEGLTLTPLISLGPDAGSMSAAEAAMGAAMGFSSFRKEQGPMYLALRLQGRFKSAYPDGRPSTNPDQPNELPGTQQRKPHLTEGVKDTAVVLVADSDVLFDSFAARRLPMFGRGVYQLMNDNINFAANLAGQLTGGEALISLRGRGSFERPFHRVLELQSKAQERWRQEELKLQEQLRLTQMRIDELQMSKTDDQKLIISPEQKQEIENFRRQLAETRAKLKEVRKNLRREIEELGLRLKVINIAAMPAVVILFGLTRGWRRRARARG